MAYYGVEIQESIIPTGTLKIYLYSQDLFAFSEWKPAIDTITEIGEITEGFDVQNGFIQGASADFSYIEDYDGDIVGYWATALAALDLEIRLTLDEGAGQTDIFWGKVDHVQAYAEELDTVTNPTRVGKFSASDILAPRLFSTPLSDVFDDIIDNARYTDDGTGSCIRVDELIASMLFVSGLNPTYALTDVTWASGGEFVCDLSNDDGFTIKTNHDYSGVALYVGFTDSDPVPGTFHLSQTFDSTHANYMPNLFYSAGELLEIMAKNLAVIPRRYYDTATDRHMIVLESRGREGAAAAATIDGTLISSKVYPRLPVSASAVMISVPSYPTSSQTYVDINGTTTTLSGDADGRSADIVGQARFFSDNENPGSAAEYVFHMLYDDTPDEWYMVWRMGYYDYDAAAQTARDRTWSQGLAEYLYKRLSEGKAYERTYSEASMTVSGVSSVANAYVGQTATVAGATYYAVQVAKDIYNNTLRVLWFKV